MSEEKVSSLPAILLERFELIDEMLARRGVPLSQRPLEAAMTLALDHIVEIETESGFVKPAECDDLLLTPWFAKIYKSIEKWYRDLYGEAIRARKDDFLHGVVLIRSTPFEIHVPRTRIEPGKSGDTNWICFLDQVQEDEIGINWLQSPPNLGSFDQESKASIELNIRTVSGALRFIAINLLGAGGTDDELAFHHGVVDHLKRAAIQIVHAETDSVKTAWWDLQLSIECALKGLSLQKMGTFKKTHDLKELLEAATQVGLGSGVAERLDGWPDWKAMSNFRYGLGGTPSIGEVYAGYIAALEVAKAAVDCMERMRLGNARIEVGRLPWTQ
jgi:HEPN domain-containing protein